MRIVFFITISLLFQPLAHSRTSERPASNDDERSLSADAPSRKSKQNDKDLGIWDSRVIIDLQKMEKRLNANFLGSVREKGTRIRIDGASVLLLDIEKETRTDAQGRFEFLDLPAGRYRLVVSALGYKNREFTIEIFSGSATENDFFLQPEEFGISAFLFLRKPSGKHWCPFEDFAETEPENRYRDGEGSHDVQSLSSLGHAVSEYKNNVIRGTGSESAAVLVDGHRIPSLFHFDSFKTTYHPSLISTLSLYPAGFGAQYGNGIGGVAEIRTRAPRRDRWGGFVDSSFLDISALLEGPIRNKMGFAIAARRSSLDLALPLITPDDNSFNTTVIPIFYDYQAKYDYKPDSNNYLSLDFYGGGDRTEFLSRLVGGETPDLVGPLGNDQMFHALFLHYHFRKGALWSEFSPGIRYWREEYSYGQGFGTRLDSISFETNEDLRIRVGKHNTFGIGITVDPKISIIESDFRHSPRFEDLIFLLGDSETNRTRHTWKDLDLGLYIFDRIDVSSVRITPGVRFDYSQNINAHAVSPRLDLTWWAVPTFSLNLSGGLYHQTPAGKDFIDEAENLEFERSAHAVGGFDWKIAPWLELEVQGVYRYLDRLIAVEKTFGSEYGYESNARGSSIGSKIMVRHNFHNNFIGMASYAFNRTVRNDGPGTRYHPSDDDHTHSLTFLASYRFLKTWQIGGRWQYITGGPYTEIEGRLFNADNGAYLPSYGTNERNNKRYGPYHRLDIRLDKKWVFDLWILYTYIDIQNVYYNRNPISVVWNYKYSESSRLTTIPIQPSFGLKAEF